MTNCKRLILISKLKCVPAQLEEHTHSGYMGNNGLNLSSYQLNNIFSIKSRGSTAMKTNACPPRCFPKALSLLTKTREVPLLPKLSIAFPQCEYDVRRSTEPADDKTREQQTPAVGFWKREYSQQQS